MKNFPIISLILIAVGFNCSGAQAHWGKMTVTDGSGNGFEAHQYPFGLGKGMVAEDQFGDSYGTRKEYLA